MFAAITSQIFLPCYFANEVVIASENLNTNMYETNWMDLPREHRQIIIIYMERLKRTLNFTVGGLFLLDMDTFVAVNI